MANGRYEVNERGHLVFGGCDCVELIQQYGTPLYVYDENRIRNMMRIYRDTLEKEYNGNGIVYYASKAFSCMGIYAIAKSEGIGVDVVSGGELYTALKAGFPAEKICMHGNNKLYNELKDAVTAGVGLIVIDSVQEMSVLNALAGELNRHPSVLLRINPGVEAHTHAYVQTATPDSKFGFSIGNGSAIEAVKQLLNKENLNFKGFHCHIGSQIFEKNSFAVAAEKCLAFIREVKNTCNFEASVLNLGGGFGIRYTDEDPALDYTDYAEFLKTLTNAVKNGCSKYGLKQPRLCIEPGRSIVGEAGITLYSVGAVREIPGIKTYVALDGGMFEAPRFALYGSRYTALFADHADKKGENTVTLAGKCCESGDIIAENVKLPMSACGKYVAVLSTGAYHYSMASNYNRNLVPPVVLVNNGASDYLVRPQSYDDLIRNDAIPGSLQQK